MPASVAMLRGRQVLLALLAQSAVGLQLRMGGTTRSLSPDTAWRLSLRLASPSAAPGTRPTSVTATVRFDEEQGYEPPQGKVRVESCLPENAFSGALSRWTLSEDPEDRKDSLWIWGLFKEPLYPFILLELECAGIELEGGGEIPAGTLYLQADHRRDPEEGVRLGAATVTYKVAQKLDADLVGLSDFTYNEPVPCGTAEFLC